MLVAAFYGFRRGEVLGLKWDAIDFERGTISVIRTVTTITVDGKQTEIEQQSAKTKSSLRTLPLIGSFREYFLQVKEAQELNKQICGKAVFLWPIHLVRHRRWRQGLLYRRAATSEVGGDRLMLGRTDDFLSEKVKEHGIARFGKRKEPVIGLITGS